MITSGFPAGGQSCVQVAVRDGSLKVTVRSADFQTVFTETEGSGDLQKHVEDHSSGTRQDGQEVPQWVGERRVQEEQERHGAGCGPYDGHSG